ncbi:MAG: 2OG-Fe(II) oxygenase [Gammaproteobacteria bacterium]
MTLMYNEYLTAVAQFPNVLTAEECRWLIDVPLPSSEAAVELRDSHVMEKSESRVDYGVRRTRIKSIPPNPDCLWIFQRLGNLVQRVNRAAYHFQLSEQLSVDVLEYDPEGYFDWHVDIGPGIFATRKLSMVTFLTPPDAYEGGNLCFMDKGEPLRLPLGTTAIFPSYMLHKVEPVTRGTRHTLVSWAHGPSFT